jgi:hypothetical protein
LARWSSALSPSNRQQYFYSNSEHDLDFTVDSTLNAKYIPSIGKTKTGDGQMSFQDAQDLAIEFGAKKFRGDHTSPTFQCWADRIAMLTIAKDTDRAIADANRYACAGRW